MEKEAEREEKAAISLSQAVIKSDEKWAAKTLQNAMKAR
jgi:hypothetical protein